MNTSVRSMSAYMDYMLGQKIRGLRQERNLSLKEVSKLSGLSIGILSQIERGKSPASIKSLRLLSDTLQIPLSELLIQSDESSKETVGWIKRKKKAPKITLLKNQISKQLITPNNAEMLDMYTAVMKPGASSGADLFITEASEIVGVVIKGTMTLSLGSEKQELYEGDSFCYEGDMPRRWENTGDMENFIVWAIARKTQSN